MYPRGELRRLAFHKAALRRRIADHRATSIAAAARVLRPIAWLDRALVFLQRISPLMVFAAVPAGYLIKRSGSSRLKTIGSLVKWVPIVFSILRGLKSPAKTLA